MFSLTPSQLMSLHSPATDFTLHLDDFTLHLADLTLPYAFNLLFLTAFTSGLDAEDGDSSLFDSSAEEPVPSAPTF